MGRAEEWEGKCLPRTNISRYICTMFSRARGPNKPSRAVLFQRALALAGIAAIAGSLRKEVEPQYPLPSHRLVLTAEQATRAEIQEAWEERPCSLQGGRAGLLPTVLKLK